MLHKTLKMKKILTLFTLFFAVATSAQNISSVSPNSGNQGSWALPITITGSGTNFSSATSTVVRIKQGTNTLQILSVNSVTPDNVDLEVNISNSSNLGSYDVEVYDQTQLGFVTLQNGFNVLANNFPPNTLAVTPNLASHNAVNLPVTISTENMNFSQATDNVMYLTQGTNTTIYPVVQSTVALNDNYLKSWFTFNNAGLIAGDVLTAHYGNSFDGFFTFPNAITITAPTAINGLIDHPTAVAGIG